MNMYYFFRRPVLKELRLSRSGKYPEDFFYGYTRLSNKFKLYVSDRAEKNRLVRFIHTLSNQLLIRRLKISISLFPVLFQLNKIKRGDGDILFPTVDSYGLALAIFKYFGFFKRKKLVVNTIGLADVLVGNKNDPTLLSFYRKIAQKVDLFISGASLRECRTMSNLLKLPISKFRFIPFGIDTDYFCRARGKSKNYVLVIGADRKRDWLLYQKLFSAFPREKFLVITHKGLVKYKMGSNVKFLYNIPISSVKKKITEAKLAVILSKQNYHFAGQSTSFRCMSMAKPVIFTNSYGVDEYSFKDGEECFLVRPGDFAGLVSVFKKLNENQDLRRKMGNLARRKIINDLSIEKYCYKLANVLTEL